MRPNGVAIYFQRKLPRLPALAGQKSTVPPAAGSPGGSHPVVYPLVASLPKVLSQAAGPPVQRWLGVVMFPLAMLLAGPLVAATPTLAAEIPPVQRVENYADTRDLPIERKISRGTEEILDWQHQINQQFGQDIRPRMAREDHPLIPAIRQMLAKLPLVIHGLASRYVVALYLLEDDFGTGTTEAVQDEAGNWHYGYIALNLSVLGRTANEWGSWKERSAFRNVPGINLEMTLEPAQDNTLEGALRFIFLHELGHVIGLGLLAHGFWDAEVLPEATRNSPFMRYSWQENADGKMVSRWANRYPLLSQLDFYYFERATLSLDQAPVTYQELAATNFPSLYGATNLFDDFAETFAIYVHTRLLRKPYAVTISQDGKNLYTYRSCVQDGRCPNKVRELERLLYE